MKRSVLAAEVDRLRLTLPKLDKIYDFFELIDEQTDHELRRLEDIQYSIILLRELFTDKLSEMESELWLKI